MVTLVQIFVSLVCITRPPIDLDFFYVKKTQPKMSDDQIQVLKYLQSRNEKGITILYDKYGSRLLGLIYGIIGDRQTSEDILQETMIKVWDHIASFDPSKASLFTWMMTIARNTAIDKQRLKSFQRGKKTETIDSLVYEGKADQGLEAGIDVARLVGTLEEKYKQVIDLIYLQGFTHQEASDHAGLPLGTVKTRLRQGLLQLREQLKGEKGLFLGLALLILLIYMLRLWI